MKEKQKKRKRGKVNFFNIFFLYECFAIANFVLNHFNGLFFQKNAYGI